MDGLEAGTVLRKSAGRASAVGLVGGAVVGPAATRRGISSCPALTPAEALYDPIAQARRAPHNWDWIGANFAIRTELARRVGPFDDELGAGAEFPAAEDTDYKLRLEAMGVKMRSTPRAVVFHTYGRRYGLPSLFRSQRNYARGNGALGAKLTLLGDPRGRQWLREQSRIEWSGWGRMGRSPVQMVRVMHFRKGYRDCLRLCGVNAAGLLYRKNQMQPRPALARN